MRESINSILSRIRLELGEGRPIPIDKRQARQLAKEAISLLRRKLKPSERPLRRRSWSLGAYETTDVRGAPVKVDVTLRVEEPRTWRSPRRYVTGGNVLSTHDTPTSYGVKHLLFIGLNSQRSPSELLANMSEVEDELYSVLVHEVTHLRDLLKPEKGLDYHNRPSEVRAFMQQISDEALAYLHHLGQDDGGWLFVGPPSSDMIQSALDSSATWERIRRDLTSANNRLVLKAVARVVSDEWSELQRLYPDDDEL